MPTEPGKPLIVISYAHADEPEKPPESDAMRDGCAVIGVMCWLPASASTRSIMRCYAT